MSIDIQERKNSCKVINLKFRMNSYKNWDFFGSLGYLPIELAFIGDFNLWRLLMTTSSKFCTAFRFWTLLFSIFSTEKLSCIFLFLEQPLFGSISIEQLSLNIIRYLMRVPYSRYEVRSLSKFDGKSGKTRPAQCSMLTFKICAQKMIVNWRTCDYNQSPYHT